jgi:hypothetical protein
MQHIKSNNISDQKHASPLISMVKSFVSGIRILMDVDAYRVEMARYENELEQGSRFTNRTAMDIDAGERDAATS